MSIIDTDILQGCNQIHGPLIHHQISGFDFLRSATESDDPRESNANEESKT